MVAFDRQNFLLSALHQSKAQSDAVFLAGLKVVFLHRGNQIPIRQFSIALLTHFISYEKTSLVGNPPTESVSGGRALGDS